MYRFPWYFTLVSTSHASSNPGLAAKQSSGYTSCNTKRGETLKYTAAKRKKEPYLFELCRPQSVLCHVRWALENCVPVIRAPTY